MPTRIVRLIGRLGLWVVLALCYALGAVTAAAVVAALTVASAVRLGWSDVRAAAERGSHGTA